MNAKFYFSTLVFVLICDFTFAQDNRVAYVKDPELTEKNNFKNTNNKPSMRNTFDQNSIVNHEPVVTSFGSSATFFRLDQTSTYDVQSDRTQIWQDPFTPVNVHITLMYSNDSDFTSIRCAYYFSNNRGESWGFVGNVIEQRSEFPTITGLSNGSVVIACHGAFYGGSVRTNIFVDVGAGFGAFGRLNPKSSLSDSYLYPAIVRSNPGQIVFAASSNTNSTTSLNFPGSFTGYNDYNGHPTGYDLAASPTGKIGHTYIGNPATDIGDVFFRESTNNGLSWGFPKKIWDYGVTKSFLGCLNGLSIVYGYNDQPYVAFETIKMQADGGFFPGLPSKIRIWSPIIDNGTSKIIADENNVPFFPNQGIVTDGFAPVCRPVIGKVASGYGLLVAFNATTGNISPYDSSVYYSVYVVSTDFDFSYPYPNRITPSVPVKDWRYVSVSKTNSFIGPYQEYHLFCQEDEIAGSHVHGAPYSLANYTAIRVELPVINVNDPSSNIPEIFSLNQNYPNPFNPKTIIEYELRERSNISLKIFDISGKEVETLVNENQSPGSYSIKWNADSYPSGVYFYELKSENYVETKRMMLLK